MTPAPESLPPETLPRIAQRLYALPPADFVAARAIAAREAGGELRAQVTALRRPSLGVHLVNLLAGEFADQLDELLAIGAALRAAQRSGDGAALRAWSARRHRALQALRATAVAQYERRSGARVSDAVGRELEATLEAALADPAASAAARSGRLMRSLTSSGLEPVDLDGAVVAPEDLPAPPSASTAEGAARTGESEAGAAEGATGGATIGASTRGALHAAPPTKPRPTAAQRRALAQADRQLAAARADHERADSLLAAAHARLSAAERELNAAQHDRSSAEQAERTARDSVRAAERAHGRAAGATHAGAVDGG